MGEFELYRSCCLVAARFAAGGKDLDVDVVVAVGRMTPLSRMPTGAGRVYARREQSRDVMVF